MRGRTMYSGGSASRAIHIAKWVGLAASLLVLLGVCFLSPSGPTQAGPLRQSSYTYTIVATSDSAVTMGDMADTLSFVVTNNGDDPAKPIDYILVEFDSSLYDISNATTAPSGWSVDEIKNAGQGQSYVVYTANSFADALAPTESQTFTVAVLGLSSGTFASASADVTDELEDTVVRYEVFAPKKDEQTYTLQGAIASWPRRGLAVSVIASPPSVAPGEFITVTMVVDNRSTASQSSIAPTMAHTPTGLVTPTLGPVPTTLTLASGGSGVITYTYQAAATGVVRFLGSAANANVTSDEQQSGDVAIGSFTALMELAPTSIVAGQDVTVRMRVYNNTGGTLGIVQPSTLAFVGDASVVSFSGPSPPVVPSLPDGSTTTFEWTYTITGTVGTTYAFTGTATASGPLTTNVAQSNSGSISEYSAYVTPRRVGSGTATPLDLVFSVANSGGVTISQAEFTFPLDFAASGGSGETVGSIGVPCSWNYSGGTFTPAGGCSGLPSGGTAALTITFSSIPSPDVETNYSFRIDLCSGSKCTTGGGAPRQDWEGAVEVPFTITPYRIEMEANPTSIPADGSSTSVITATVYMGSSPLPNADVVFATTGTEGTLSSYGGITDGNGVITVTFTSPVDFADSVATIIATYLTTEGRTTVNLVGIAGPNPQYVGGTLSPTTVQRGETVAFTLDVLNMGNWPITLTTSSVFTLTDGTHIFTASLAAPTVVPIDAQRTLTFTAATVNPSFATGNYNPEMRLIGTEAGQDYDRPVSDQVSVVVPPSTVRFSSSSYAAGEGTGPAVVTVTLSPSSSLTVTVDYGSSDGTAEAGSDYTTVSDTLAFAPGGTSLTFTVPITDDVEVEGNETVDLALSNPINASLGTPDQAVLTITDNDWPIYRILSRVGDTIIVAHVRMEGSNPVILSWEILQ